MALQTRTRGGSPACCSRCAIVVKPVRRDLRCRGSWRAGVGGRSRRSRSGLGADLALPALVYGIARRHRATPRVVEDRDGIHRAEPDQRRQRVDRGDVGEVDWQRSAAALLSTLTSVAIAARELAAFVFLRRRGV